MNPPYLHSDTEPEAFDVKGMRAMPPRARYPVLIRVAQVTRGRLSRVDDNDIDFDPDDYPLF